MVNTLKLLCEISNQKEWFVMWWYLKEIYFHHGILLCIAHVTSFQDVPKAKQFLPFLQRAGRSDAVVEFVASGSRLRLFLPRETCLITFLISGDFWCCWGFFCLFKSLSYMFASALMKLSAANSFSNILLVESSYMCMCFFHLLFFFFWWPVMD